jgi:Trypsin-co-occurring domain 2
MAKVPIKGLSLSELIESTANELRIARDKVKDQDAVMQFNGCELELAVTVKGEAGGGIKFWVVDASTKIAGEAVSKVKLSFGAIPGKVLQFLAERAGEGRGPAAPSRKGETSHG